MVTTGRLFFVQDIPERMAYTRTEGISLWIIITIAILLVLPGQLVTGFEPPSNLNKANFGFPASVALGPTPATTTRFVMVNQSLPIQALGMAWGGEVGTAGSLAVFTGGNGIWDAPASSPGNLLTVQNTGSGYWQLATPDGNTLLLGGTAYGCPGGVRLGEIYGNNGTFQGLSNELPAAWTQSGPCRDLETMSYGNNTTLMVQAKNTYQNTQVGTLNNGAFTNLTVQFNLYPCCYNYFSAFGNGTFLVVTSGSGYLYRPSTGIVTNVSSVLKGTMNNGLGQAQLVQYYRGNFLIGYQTSLVAYNDSTNSISTLYTVPAGGGQTAFVTQNGNQTYLGVVNGSHTWIYNSSGSGFHLMAIVWGDLADLEASGQNLFALGMSYGQLEGILYDFVPSTTMVNITETGLPAGTRWSAEVDCSYSSGTGSTLSFAVPPNSTYSYSVNGPAGYGPTPHSGTISVAGSGSTLSVKFGALGSSVSTSTSWQAVGPHEITGGPGGTSTGQLDGPVCGTLEATGEVQAIATNSANPLVIYASGGGWIINSASGVAKTVNGGITWTPVNNGLSDRVVNTLWMDPSNSSILLAGTLNGGIYRTQNAGLNWSLVQPGSSVKSIVSFNGSVYAAAGAPQGVLRSTDDGRTWSDTWSGMSAISSPNVLATNGKILYAGTGAQGGIQGAIYWTTDGLNWTREPSIVGSILGLAASYANLSTIYAGINPSGAYTNAYVAVSHNRGASWTNLTLPNGWPQPVATDPNYPNIFYVGIDGTFYTSSDNGSTFQEANIGGTDVRIILPLSGHPGMLFVGADQGIYETTNNGVNWTSLAGNLNFSLTYSVAVHNSSLFASMQDFSPVASLNGGATWATTAGFEGGAVYINPLNSSYVYSLTGGGFEFSKNGGANFTSIPLNVNGGNQNIDPIAVDPNNSLRVYVAGVPGVYVSNNGGSTFSLEPWPFTSTFMVVVDPASNLTLFVSNATGSWVTHDGGASWTPISVPNGGVIWSLTVDPAHPLVMAATTTNAHSEVVRSVDGGDTFAVSEQGVIWQPFPTGFSLRSISFDPTGKYLVLTTATGIYLSLDTGLTWGDIAYNATASYFTGVAWDQGYLYASTYGEGILRLWMGNATYYPVQFTEKGLPGAVPWYVSLLGSVQGTTSPNMTFMLPDGTYSYLALPGGAWNTGEFYPQNSSGTVVVNGGGISVVIYFPTLQSITVNPSSATCYEGRSVSFNATAWTTSGSPIGWGTDFSWSINIPSLGTLNTTEGELALFTASNLPGNLSLFVNVTYNGRTLQSSPILIQVLSPSRTYNVRFNEGGLPSGTSWSVTMDGRVQSSSLSSILFTNLLNNTTGYPFTVGTVSGYASSPSSGTIPVRGANVTQNITFSALPPLHYAVTFTESGLPSGTQWWINVTGGPSTSSTTTTLSFSEPNGTYAYTVAASDKVYSSLGGSFTVNGAGVSLRVPFTLVTYVVTFTESGLPSGTQWWINVTGGPSTSSTTTTLSFSEPNGTYAYTVAASDKVYSAHGGSFTVNGGALSLSVPFTLVTYVVTFTESGLPSGTSWSVTLNGTAKPGTGNIVFMEPNGTYSFSVGAVSGYTVLPSSGSLTVSGVAVGKAITFTAMHPGQYSLTFSESGLPVGTNWSVTVGSTTHTSTGSTISFTEMNGTYSYTIGAVAGYTATPSSGSVTMNGAAKTVSVAFAKSSTGTTTYTVTFTETGLSVGTSWSVTLNGSTKSSTTATITFQEANGSYSFTVGSVSGYTVGPSPGTIKVNGAAVSQPITFTSSTSQGKGNQTTGFLGLSGYDGYILIGVIVVAVATGALILLLRKRSPPRGSGSVEDSKNIADGAASQVAVE